MLAISDLMDVKIHAALQTELQPVKDDIRDLKEHVQSLEQHVNSLEHHMEHRMDSLEHQTNGLEHRIQKLEQLPDFTAATRIHPSVARHTICVMDSSGSMLSRIGATNLSARNVVNALAIYFAERCVGPFHNRYLTFSAHPRLVDLSNAHTLREKLELTLAYEEVANTNIEAVFDLILQTAVAHRLTQQELPHTVLILSDMEFDACVDSGDFSLFQR